MSFLLHEGRELIGSNQKSKIQSFVHPSSASLLVLRSVYVQTDWSDDETLVFNLFPDDKRLVDRPSRFARRHLTRNSAMFSPLVDAVTFTAVRASFDLPFLAIERASDMFFITISPTCCSFFLSF